MHGESRTVKLTTIHLYYYGLEEDKMTEQVDDDENEDDDDDDDFDDEDGDEG